MPRSPAPAGCDRLGHHRAPTSTGSRCVLRRHRHRRSQIEVPRVGQRPRLDADVGDVGELEALVVDRQVADFVNAAPLSDRLHVITRVAILDQPARRGKVRARQTLIQIVEANAGRGEPIGVDFDLHFARRHALNLHLCVTGNALERTLQFAIEQFVGVGQVVIGRDAQIQDRLVRRGALEYLVAPQIRGKVGANRVDLAARLDRFDRGVLAPLELHVDVHAVGARHRMHALDAGQGRQRFLDRARQRALDFGRRGALVRQHDFQKWKLDVGHRLQRQPERGDQADHRHRHERHDDGDGTPGSARQSLTLLPRQPGRRPRPPRCACARRVRGKPHRCGGRAIHTRLELRPASAASIPAGRRSL